MDIRRRLGKAIQRIRIEQQLSQEELAFRARLHRTYISGVERGVRNPTITVVEKIAVALGVAVGELIN